METGPARDHFFFFVATYMLYVAAATKLISYSYST